MAKKPASPTADVETQSERIKNLSLQDVDTLVERQRRIEVELKHLAEELKITVQDADYAKAAKIQAEEASLHAETHDIREARAMISRLKKQRAREAAGATQTLPPASSLRQDSLAVWNARLKEVLTPLEPAVETTLVIIADALKLAAAEGMTVIHLRDPPDVDSILKDLFDPEAAPSLNKHRLKMHHAHYNDPSAHHAYVDNHEKYKERVKGILAKIQFMVDLDFCWIPVGETLCDDADFEIFWRHHGTIAGFAAEAELDDYVTLASNFDGEAVHNSNDLVAVMSSDFATMNLRWRLDQAGYVSSGGTLLKQTVETFHRKNHARNKEKKDGAEPSRFRSSEFRALNIWSIPNPKAEVFFTVAYGEGGERLRATLKGTANVDGFLHANQTRRTFTEYVEYTTLDAADTKWMQEKDNTIPHATLQAAGTLSLRNLCAREKFMEHERSTGTETTTKASASASASPSAAATPVRTPAKSSPAGGKKTAGGVSSSPLARRA